MSESAIKAVSFDLWDTIFVDDSDEIERKARGLLSKRELRRKLVTDALASIEPISEPLVRVAYDTVDAAFQHVWTNQGVTWSVTKRLSVLFQGLGRELHQDVRDRLVRMHEEMELEVRPVLAPGIRQALETLHEDYRLAILSDTVFSPGRVLRKILIEEGLLELFGAFVFSDELGRSKPHAAVFEAGADLLGVKTNEMIHVGDREFNDIVGSKRAGCKAVLTTVVKDRRSDPTQADAVCEDYSKLKDIIDSLSGVQSKG